MDHRPKCKMQNYKTPKANTEENLGDLGLHDDLLGTISKE